MGVDNAGAQGDGFCPNLEHQQYDVVPIKRDGDSLFRCFWKILQERAPEDLPCDILSLRGLIDNDLRTDEGVSVQYEDIVDTRTGTYASGQNLLFGSLSVICAFSKRYRISVSVHCPETTDGEPVHFDFGNPPELLLHTLGWENEKRKGEYDHWQRLQRRQHQSPIAESTASFSPVSHVPDLQQSTDMRKTHHKLDNPRNFPLPRSDTIILRERVYLQVSVCSFILISELIYVPIRKI